MLLPAHDRPETYSAYRSVAKVRLNDGSGNAVLGLKETGLVVHFDDGEALHFDLEGRLLRVAVPGLQWRRGLSGRMLRLSRQATGDAAARDTVWSAPSPGDRSSTVAGVNRDAVANVAKTPSVVDEADCEPRQPVTLIRAANRRMQAAHAAYEAALGTDDDEQTSLRDAVTRAAAFDEHAATHDLDAFRELYHDIPILPPDQYQSLVLLASDGCSYNQCTFCNFYRDRQYRLRPLGQFQQHVDAAVRYHGAALAARRDIFLGQANALLGPRAWREEILQYVNQRFEFPPSDRPAQQGSWWRGSPTRFNGITSFLDALAGTRITVDEFAALRRLNLKQVYIGLESGAAELLQWLRKPAEPQQMLGAVRAAKQGGVATGVIVLIGVGGERYFDAHVRETVALIHAMQLAAGDFIYLSPLVPAHGAEYDDLAAEADIQPLSPPRMKEQEQLLRSGIGSLPRGHGPYVAHYEVERFVY